MDLSNNQDAIYTIYTKRREWTNLSADTVVVDGEKNIASALMLWAVNFGTRDDFVLGIGEDPVGDMYREFMDTMDHPEVATDAMEALLHFIGKVTFKIIRNIPKKTLFTPKNIPEYVRHQLYDEIKKNRNLEIARNHMVICFGEDDADHFISSVSGHLANQKINRQAIYEFFTLNPN